jgi:hypothetical protein
MSITTIGTYYYKVAAEDAAGTSARPRTRSRRRSSIRPRRARRQSRGERFGNLAISLTLDGLDGQRRRHPLQRLPLDHLRFTPAGQPDRQRRAPATRIAGWRSHLLLQRSPPRTRRATERSVEPGECEHLDTTPPTRPTKLSLANASGTSISPSPETGSPDYVGRHPVQRSTVSTQLSGFNPRGR